MTTAAANLEPGKKVLVCFAMKVEAAPFRRGITGTSGVSILLVGIGRQNAEKSLSEHLAGDRGALKPASRLHNVAQGQTWSVTMPPAPTFVLTCGFAGGLNPAFKSGDILFETADENLRARLLSAGAKSAGFYCADRIAITAGEKQSLRKQTGADAVEMESGAIQEVCGKLGVPCATVRAISDSAGEDLPLDFNALSKPDKNLDYGKLFLEIARSPGKIGALRQLQKQTGFAARQLAGVLNRVIFP